MPSLWDKLCDAATLKKGWHLVSHDLSNEFIFVPFEKEQYAFQLDRNLEELSRKLESGEFIDEQAIHGSVPKGLLSTRPADYIPLESRIILFAAITLIAKRIDNQLIEGVTSCRVKNNIKNSLFKQPQIKGIPFLKRSVVDIHLSPFEAWYEAWPLYINVFRRKLVSEGYRYLAKADISEYFENIHLEILRELLNKNLNSEQNIVNHIYNSYSAWTKRTQSGHRLMRGLPQGSDATRFFGNCFLMPVDEAMSKIPGIRYYRYMDDIQIFSKDLSKARASILKFDEEIRKQHLNLQSAKTEIFDHNLGEIEAALFDSRIDTMEQYKNQIDGLVKNPPVDFEAQKEAMIKNLDDLMRAAPDASSINQVAIIGGSQKPLSGLSESLFRRIISGFVALKCTNYLPRLLSELKVTQDKRLYDKLVVTSKAFPKRVSIGNFAVSMLHDRTGSVRDYQKGQILKALRYQSRVPPKVFNYALSAIVNTQLSSFLRVEACLLLARAKINGKIITAAEKVFAGDNDILLKRCAALILIRKRGNSLISFLDEISGHPNPDLRKFGTYLKGIISVPAQMNILKERVLDLTKHPHLLADYYPLVQMFIEGVDEKNGAIFLNAIKGAKNYFETPDYRFKRFD